MRRFIVAWFWGSDIACIGTVVRNADNSLCNFSGAVLAIGLKRSVYHSEAGMRNRRSGAGTKGSTNERQIGEDGANGRLDTGSVTIANAIHVCKILYLRQFAQKIDECSTWMNQESCPPPFDNEISSVDAPSDASGNFGYVGT